MGGILVLLPVARGQVVVGVCGVEVEAFVVFRWLVEAARCVERSEHLHLERWGEDGVKLLCE